MTDYPPITTPRDREANKRPPRPAPVLVMTDYTCVSCGRHWRTNETPRRCPYCGYDRSAPRPDPPPGYGGGRRGR